MRHQRHCRMLSDHILNRIGHWRVSQLRVLKPGKIVEFQLTGNNAWSECTVIHLSFSKIRIADNQRPHSGRQAFRNMHESAGWMVKRKAVLLSGDPKVIRVPVHLQSAVGKPILEHQRVERIAAMTGPSEWPTTATLSHKNPGSLDSYAVKTAEATNLAVSLNCRVTEVHATVTSRLIAGRLFFFRDGVNETISLLDLAGHSNWIATISERLPTRSGGPQVPAPQEV